MNKPALKLVFNRGKRVRRAPPPRKDKWGATRAQRGARQMNWTVYISEGLVANLMHSQQFVSHDMTPAQKAILRTATIMAERVVLKLREGLPSE